MNTCRPRISLVNVTLIATIWPVFHYGFILLLSCKKPPAYKDHRQCVAFKEYVAITALCSIKKALSQRNADNFDPAVRKIKGQDRCRGMQNTRFLPAALFLSLYPSSLQPWILPFD